MGEVIKLPVKKPKPTPRKAELTTREIWSQSENVTELMAWEVCPYLRNQADCNGCQEWDTEIFNGEEIHSKKGCRAMAEEACRVVLAAKKKSE